MCWFILQVGHLVLVHIHVYLFILRVSSCVSVYTAGDQLGLVHTYKYLCYRGPCLVLVCTHVSVYTAGDPAAAVGLLTVLGCRLTY